MDILSKLKSEFQKEIDEYGIKKVVLETMEISDDFETLEVEAKDDVKIPDDLYNRMYRFIKDNPSIFSNDPNINKHLVNIGDFVVSKKYGIGRVINVNMDDDCQNPISVTFDEDSVSRRKTKYLDCKGGSQGEDVGDAKFYLQTNL